MSRIFYSPPFNREITKVRNELDRFFKNIPKNKPSLKEYRRKRRHAQDLKWFNDTLDSIAHGRTSLGRVAIGSILSNRKIYILVQGPWRGYFKVRSDGQIVGLQFVDCR